MATIGQALTVPEPGWKRYDNSHPDIKYEGNKWGSSILNNRGLYNDTYANANEPTDNHSIKFDFTGSKLRIIAAQYIGMTEQLSIEIDGKEIGIASLTLNSSTGSLQGGRLVFDVQDLPEGMHKARLHAKDNKRFNLDAIDIDSEGRLLHPDEVTDVKDLEVGKRIRCHYQATANQVGTFSGLGEETSDFIPPASSATPNGDFYFIMVEDWNGKKRLIADRNIQHSISWDVLNSSGIASGSGLSLIIGDDLHPSPMTSNSGVYTALSSHNTAAGSEAYRVFDKGNRYEWRVNYPNSVWVSLDIKRKVIVNSYTILGSHGTAVGVDETIKSWRLEGSNDGVNWHLLDVRENQQKWLYGEKRSFTFNNEVEYQHFRIYVQENQGAANYTGIGQITLSYDRYDKFVFTTRLLTGGVSSADKDNEWDKYIVNSTLNGAITAGDNNVWNWNQIASFTSTTGNNGSGNRVHRGWSNATYWNAESSAKITPTQAFRPVLEIESLGSPPITASFIYHNGQYKKYVSTIEEDMVKDESFTEEGTLLRIPLNSLVKKVEVQE